MGQLSKLNLFNYQNKIQWFSNFSKFPLSLNLLFQCMKRIEQGYSLLELMIVISLSLFLSMEMINIFIHSKNIYRLTQSLNTISTKAGMAFYLLSHDIRMAGFVGCVRLIDNLQLNNHLTGNASLVVWHKGYTTAKLSLPKLAGIKRIAMLF